MATYHISIGSDGNADPATLNCRSGDKITWTNNYTQSVTGFTLPSCVSPSSSPAPVAVGATTRKFTVNSGAGGNYSYSYSWPSPGNDTRGGTIDVS